MAQDSTSRGGPHHFPNRPAYLRRLARALKPSGRLVNIDYHKRETPVGPPLEHRVSREAFLEEAKEAGLKLVTEHGFLPHQYFLVLQALTADAATPRARPQ
jgi:ubiquinone/menaquinone biosynthesis C-methylase UbiE